jgi:hypothetical protein
MINLLDAPVKELKIIHLEDDRITQRIVHDLIKIRFDSTSLIQHDNGIAVCLDLPFEKPDVLIVDWMLKDCCAKDLLNTLKRHKGIVIFFSGNDASQIQSCIEKELHGMPKNFKVLSKSAHKSYDALMKEISNYAYSIDKEI